MRSKVGRWVRRFKDGELEQADLSDKTRNWKACDGFQKLLQPWRKCIEVCGDFVEK